MEIMYNSELAVMRWIPVELNKKGLGPFILSMEQRGYGNFDVLLYAVEGGG